MYWVLVESRHRAHRGTRVGRYMWPGLGIRALQDQCHLDIERLVEDRSGVHPNATFPLEKAGLPINAACGQGYDLLTVRRIEFVGVGRVEGLEVVAQVGSDVVRRYPVEE